MISNAGLVNAKIGSAEETLARAVQLESSVCLVPVKTRPAEESSTSHVQVFSIAFHSKALHLSY